MQRIFGKRYQPSLTSAALPRRQALASPTLAQIDNPTDDPPQKSGDLERALACGGCVAAPPRRGVPAGHVTQRPHPAERPPPGRWSVAASRRGRRARRHPRLRRQRSSSAGEWQASADRRTTSSSSSGWTATGSMRRVGLALPLRPRLLRISRAVRSRPAVCLGESLLDSGRERQLDRVAL